MLLVFAAAILLVAAYKGGRWLETRNAQPEARGDRLQRYAYEDTIEVDGTSYRRRKNVTSILLMGIDRANDTVVTGYRNGGQADFLQLVVIDSDEQKITRLQIDRDTMTPITILGVLGNQSGVRTSQICLSHGFGDGKEQSCELTVSAVSNLLLGTPIDSYIAMNLDGISILNDAVGGVTVTLEDDFSALDASMTPGRTMTLVGDQAEIFVRSRRNIGVGTNEARMARQQQYIARLAEQLDGLIQADEAFIGSLYDELKPYLITNLSRGALINRAWTSRAYGRTLHEIEGTYQVGTDEFMQFYADETVLQQIVLELFYQKVE
ncbi:MAG: LCP family protein [Clostridia bacterium]|nr:LCP family protein [Clostridia bacterium]